MCVFLTPSLLCFLSTSLTTEPISLKFGMAIDNAGFIQAFLNREKLMVNEKLNFTQVEPQAKVFP